MSVVGELVTGAGSAAIGVARAGVGMFGGMLKALAKAINPEDEMGFISGAESAGTSLLNTGEQVANQVVRTGVSTAENLAGQLDRAFREGPGNIPGGNGGVRQI
jgi:uncharacterized membrane protein